MFTVGGGPRNKSHPVKAHKPSLGSDPQVAVGSLGDGLRCSIEETVGDPPCGVGILGYLPGGVECGRRNRKESQRNKDTDQWSQAERLQRCPKMERETTQSVAARVQEPFLRTATHTRLHVRQDQSPRYM